MFALLGAAISSILAGGATGLFGVILQRFFDWLHVKEQAKLAKQDQDFKLAMRDKDAILMDKEWAGRLKVADREGQATENVAADNAFAQSLFKEPERYSLAATLTPSQQWVMIVLDFLRGIVRPALTVYLCALTTYVWWQVRQLIATEDLDAAAVLELWKFVVSTILYLTTTCILWWFGTRNKQEAPKQPR